MRIFLLLTMTAALVTGTATAQDTATADAGTKPGTRPAVGDQVRDFDLPIVGSDKTLKLSEAYKDGPVVVVMLRGYPGYQCGICSRQYGKFREAAKNLAKTAKHVIMVYPGGESQLETHANEFVGDAAIPAPIVMVRDPGMKMVQDWDLRWKAPRETAYPATFVIDQSGKVVWAKVSEGHDGRSTVDDVAKALASL